LPLKDAAGNIIQWFGTNTDITESKKAEEMLKLKLEELTQSNEELEQFDYVSSHDLQEPLRLSQVICSFYKGDIKVISIIRSINTSILLLTWLPTCKI